MRTCREEKPRFWKFSLEFQANLLIKFLSLLLARETYLSPVLRLFPVSFPGLLPFVQFFDSNSSPFWNQDTCICHCFILCCLPSPPRNVAGKLSQTQRRRACLENSRYTLRKLSRITGMRSLPCGWSTLQPGHRPGSWLLLPTGTFGPWGHC